MRSAIFATMMLLAGCGTYQTSTYTTTPYSDYQPPPTHTYPNEPAGATAYVIDPNAGVVAEPASYAITTSDGTVWRLAWLGDQYQRSYHGTISCPTGCAFGYGRFVNPETGDTVTVTNNDLTFDWVSDASTVQYLDFSAPVQPLTFDLYIDNTPAIQAVLFMSGGVRSTTDVMPFALYDAATAGFSVGGKTKLAPQFVSKLPGTTTQAVTVAPPERASAAVRIGGVAVQTTAEKPATEAAK